MEINLKRSPQEEFLLACAVLRKGLQKRGVLVTQKNPLIDDYLRTLPPEILSFMNENLGLYNKVFMETSQELGDKAWNDKVFLWNYLKELKWRLPTDCMSMIREGDVFEILDSMGRQIFRSMSFFFITSYDLESFFSKAWHQLYTRDSKVDVSYMEFHALVE